MKTLVRILASVTALVLVVAAAGYYVLIVRPLPQTGGELTLAGLSAPVRVIRDQWGVPHIYARDEHDLLMAQGFVQAQDRLWQLEANRRLAAGRLSEILGEKTVELDKLMRTFGLMRAARGEVAAYDAPSRALLQAFADGVNAFVAANASRLPLEFRLLGIRPEPWQPADSIAWAKFMALSGSKNWQEEIVRAMLVQKLGPARAADLLGRIQAVAPPIVPPDAPLGEMMPPLDTAGGDFGLGGASNNWAVHGSRTATGQPLLANDMHVALRIPSVWHEVHLAAGELDVIGLSLTGVPYVIVGHNQELAWGITFAYGDIQDVYYEKLNPADPTQYRYQGQWLAVEVIDEPIRVKGRTDAVAHQVRLTRHGPLISAQVPKAEGSDYALALKWSAHDPGGMAETLWQLNHARNWQAFKAAAQRWCEPSVNLVYADRQGNIGYVLGSRIPLRAQGHGRGPFEGWSGDNEWTGYLAADQKPFVFNPPPGLIATANHPVVDEGFVPYIAQDYALGHRAARITQVLGGMSNVSVEACRKLQGDYHNLAAGPMIAALGKVRVNAPQARKLLERLESWDQTMGPDSVEGAIFAVLCQRLLENTFADELGPLTERFFGVGLTYIEPLNRFAEYAPNILQGLLAEPDSHWFDDSTTPERETLAETLEKSLNQTERLLVQRLGSDPQNWRWGRLHTVELAHPLGSVKPLDRLLNLGPFEGGGHFATVMQSAVMPGDDFKLNGWSASNRHIYDVQDWDRSLGAIVPGQSGLYGSAHYRDQMDLWLAVDHHPLYYTRQRVEKEAAAVLALNP
jgi:penicillin amidase